MSILTREGRGSSGVYLRGGEVHQKYTYEGGEGSIRSILTSQGRGSPSGRSLILEKPRGPAFLPPLEKKMYDCKSNPALMTQQSAYVQRRFIEGNGVIEKDALHLYIFGTSVNFFHSEPFSCQKYLHAFHQFSILYDLLIYLFNNEKEVRYNFQKQPVPTLFFSYFGNYT